MIWNPWRLTDARVSCAVGIMNHHESSNPIPSPKVTSRSRPDGPFRREVIFGRVPAGGPKMGLS